MPTEFRSPTRRSAWEFAPTCPDNWNDWLTSCGGGFFQSPPALHAGAPEGEPVFCVHRGPDGVDAVAFGVRSSCRLSRQARHVYFPSVPAVRSQERAGGLVQDLLDGLREAGAAEVVMDSYDARWTPRLRTASTEVHREEYTIPLDGTPEERLARCASNHRRNIRKGDRSGWQLRRHAGEDAGRVLERVQAGARVRAAGRGAPITAPPVVSVADAGIPSRSAWGITVFGAWASDELLGAMMVGWAGGRGYYVAGGGTPAGYQAGAGAWLHWRIAETLAGEGFTDYNLGGGPMEPADDTGLRRFKRGFGSTEADCWGATWRLRRLHAQGHQARRLLAGWLHS